jgi:hypothetical protein
MAYISKNKARQIASEWYDGQWSALYQFLSSGVYLPENHSRYIKEVNELYTYAKNKKQTNEINQLKRWFMYKKNESK